MEVWKDIEVYKGLYQVSSEGKVRSLDRYEKSKGGSLRFRKGRILAQTKRKNGYLTVSLNREGVNKKHLIHRLVAKAFIHNIKNLPEVNHEDGNKENNHTYNLVWCTSSYNQKHVFDNGLQKARRGSSNGQAKLNENEINEIKKLYTLGRYSQSILGNMFGISRSQVGRIVRGERWAHMEVIHNE